MNANQRKQGYQKSFQAHGESPKSLQWHDYRAAAIRYRELVADIDITGRSILDAGCGMGDLVPFLFARSLEFDYAGMDITPEFIATARKRYDGLTFKVGDPFEASFTNTFDVIFCSGVLNAKHKDWFKERTQMIKKLFDQANEVLAFNMAGYAKADTASSEAAKRVFYADSEQIISFCYSLTPKLVVRSQYHPKDFTVILYK